MPFFKTKTKNLPRSQMLESLNKRNGPRHTIFNTVGDKYTGEWKDDKKCGKGVILTRNKELYEGDMQDNYRHGFGVLAQAIPGTDVFKLVYRGDWKRGRMQGDGMFRYPDGSIYHGGFKRGKREGHGTQWFADGAFFDGEFKDDKRNGLGVFIRADGNRYEGEWQNDMKHGKGHFIHLDTGQLQDGYWYDDNCCHSSVRDIEYKMCTLAPTVCPFKVLAEFKSKSKTGFPISAAESDASSYVLPISQ